MQIIYAQTAIADLDSLDIRVAQRIVRKIRSVAEAGHILSQSKALAGELIGYRRIRIGDYRAIIQLVKQTKIHVLVVRHRSQVYE